MRYFNHAKKKFLFVLSSMNIGGVEKSLLSLLALMPKDKYDITILLLERKGGFLKYLPDWVKVEEAGWYGKIKPIIMEPPQHTVRMYLKKRQYTKIPSFLFVYFTSKYTNDRYIFYRHVFKTVPKWGVTYDVAISYQGPTDIIDFFVANKVTAGRKISWVHFDVSQFTINKKLYNRLYEKFDKVFAVSKEAGKRLAEQIPAAANKADIFLNVVSYSLIKSMSREKVKMDDNFTGIKIVTVGRLSREKGQDIAIKVLARLKRDGYKVRWYLVGDGRDRKLYESMAAQYGLNGDCILVGATPNPYPYMAKADIYVQPSRHEGYCLTLSEAKCLGKPIITTDFAGAREQITDGYNGFIVKCSEDELYEKVRYLIDNPAERKRLSGNLEKATADAADGLRKFEDCISDADFLRTRT